MSEVSGKNKVMFGEDVRIVVNPRITPEELFAFYERNQICETGFGKDVAARVLTRSSLIVGAFENEQLVGLVRAMFDGLSAAIMEFSLELKYQGKDLKYNNGSLMEKDSFGLGKQIGRVLVDELLKQGATFFSIYLVEGCEEEFYRSLGFELNRGHAVYYLDKRPYVMNRKV